MRTLQRQIKYLQQQNLTRQQAAAQQQAKYYNKHRRTKRVPIKVGDMVRWKRPRLQKDQKKKLAKTWLGPYTVTRKVGDVNYELKDENGKIMDTLAHASDLTVVNGERPTANSSRAAEKEQQFAAWCLERQRGYEEASRIESQTGGPVLRGT